MTAPTVRHITINEYQGADQRLDNFLIGELKGVPKTHIYQLIRSGQVRVNKGRAKAETKLAIGDVVRIPPVRVSENATKPEPRIPATCDWTVLFEDSELMVINKPAGLAVHGGSGVAWGLIEQLRQNRPEERGLELVHRLDKETSGAILIAKKRSALTQLQAQLQKRQMEKIYAAWVHGAWPASWRRVDTPLFKYVLANGERRVRAASPDQPGAQTALTFVELQKQTEHLSLLRVTLKTGRTHQIRVHLASKGFPIAGDDKYGDDPKFQKIEATLGISRMLLHAQDLNFIHPKTHERVHIHAPCPVFDSLLKKLGPVHIKKRNV